MIFVLINKRNWRHPGPIVNVGIHHAHSLAALGYETHFCVGAGDPSDTAEDLEAFYGLAPQPTLHVHRIQRHKLGGSTSSLSILRQTHRLIRNLARRDEITVITREGSFLPLLAWWQRDPRIRCYFEAHDFYADLSWRQERPRFQERKLGWFERLFIPRISGVIAIVEPQAELYRARFPDVPVVSLPLGTKPGGPGDPAARLQQRRVVYTGHLHASKGVPTILDAVADPADRLFATFFGGSAAQGARFGRGCSSAEFRSFRPPEEVHRDLQTRASVGVVALRDTFYNARLTCPVKALDYLSHGLPVIASDLPTTRDVLGDAAIYIPPGDSAALRRALLALLDDEAEYVRRSKLSWQRAQQLSWNQRAQRLVAAVRQESPVRTSPAARQVPHPALRLKAPGAAAMHG